MSFFKSIGHALGKVGHVALAPVKFTAKVSGNVLGAIPVVGKPLHAALDVTLTGPLVTADAITKGARVDHAVLSGVKIQAKGISTVAPYAQLVLKQVPIAGLGVDAAIAAGAALAQGKRIDKVIVDGVKGAVPANLQSVFDNGFKMASTAVNDNRAQMNAEMKKLPAQAQKVYHSAMALGHGKRLQDVLNKAASSAGTILSLKTAGAAKVTLDPVLSAGNLVLADPDTNHGYQLAIGTFDHNTQPTALDAIRATLTGNGLLGFNIGMAVHVGMALHTAPIGMAPREQFGYFAVYGMQTATNQQKTDMLGIVSHDNSARVGVNAAIAELGATGWWPKIKAYVSKHIHLKKKIAA